MAPTVFAEYAVQCEKAFAKSSNSEAWIEENERHVIAASVEIRIRRSFTQ